MSRPHATSPASPDFPVFLSLATLREFHMDHYADMGGLGALIKFNQMEAKVLEVLVVFNNDAT